MSYADDTAETANASGEPGRFTFYTEPSQTVPGVFTGVGQIADESERVYITTNGDALITRSHAIDLAIRLLRHATEMPL